MKDPAALFYIDTWLSATAEMDSDVRGWYLNLILHQYDKKSLPDDIEKLAVMAGVKFSEYVRFEQVFKQVLQQKFERNEDGRLENKFASDILKKREAFLDKRSNAGKMSYISRFIYKNITKEADEIQYIKDNISIDELDLKNEHLLKQVFKHLLELYINGDKDIDSSIKIDYSKLIDYWNDNCGNCKKIMSIEGSRRKHVTARIKQYGKDKMLLAISKVSKSDFLQGKKTDFLCTFDFMIKAENFLKIIEGNYDNGSATGNTDYISTQINRTCY